MIPFVATVTAKVMVTNAVIYSEEGNVAGLMAFVLTVKSGQSERGIYVFDGNVAR